MNCNKSATIKYLKKKNEGGWDTYRGSKSTIFVSIFGRDQRGPSSREVNDFMQANITLSFKKNQGCLLEWGHRILLLKAPTKIAADDTLFFSFEENKA